MISLYYNLIYPYLIYGNLIWGKTYQVHINRILLLQKKAVRIISFADYRAHSSPLFLENNLLKIQEINSYNVAVYWYKRHLSTEQPAHEHNYGTRGRDRAIPTFRRLTSTQRSLTYLAPIVWNELPSTVKNSASLSIFKKRLKKHLLNYYR